MISIGIGSLNLNFSLSLGSINSLTVSNITIDEIPIPAVIGFALPKWDAIPIHSCSKWKNEQKINSFDWKVSLKIF